MRKWRWKLWRQAYVNGTKEIRGGAIGLGGYTTYSDGQRKVEVWTEPAAPAGLAIIPRDIKIWTVGSSAVPVTDEERKTIIEDFREWLSESGIPLLLWD